MRTMRWWVLGAWVAILPAAEATAADWHVDQSAPAGGDGSDAAPFQTINDVRSVLETGDTVWIRDGVYQETVDFWHVSEGAGERTTIRAAEGHQPIIDGGGAGGNYVLQAGETHSMTFQGLTVRNHGGSAFHFYYADDGQVIDCVTENVGRAVSFYHSSRGTCLRSDLGGGVSGKESDGTTIEACRVHHSDAEGITLHADSSNLQYLNNVVHDNHSVQIYIDSAHDVVVDGNLVFNTDEPDSELAGIQLADESYDNVTSPILANVVITNNVIVNNFYGIVFWDGHFPGQSAMRNVLIANNTVVNNARLGIVWDEGPHQDAVIRNNIFVQDGVGVLLFNAKSTSGVTLDHNLWWMPGVDEPFNWGGGETFDHPGWVAASGQGDADVLADPAFQGPADLDASSYRVTEGSPAIDSGAAIDGLTIDYDRGLRPAGSGYDLGAFEYGADPNPDGGPPPVPDAGSGGSGASGTGGSTVSSTPRDPDDDGCGCALPGGTRPPWGPALLWTALLSSGWLRRRARRGGGRGRGRRAVG